MASLSVISWNIEHFSAGGGIDDRTRPARQRRVQRVADLLKQETPDVFGIREVEGKAVFERFTRDLPD